MACGAFYNLDDCLSFMDHQTVFAVNGVTLVYGVAIAFSSWLAGLV